MSALETTAALVPPHGRQQMLRALATDPRSAAGLVLVGLVIVAALCAPLLAPFDPELPDFASTLAPPTGTHLLGTDELGRDVLSRILYGARASLYVGVLSVTLAAVAGTLIGLAAGFFGRWVDALTMRAMDTIFAFPSICV